MPMDDIRTFQILIKPYHGICLFGSQIDFHPYEQTDFNRFVDWGINSVHINLYWGVIESDEMQPNVYDTMYLQKLDTLVALCAQNNIFPVLSIQDCLDPDAQPPPSYVGWPGKYKSDYINLNEQDLSGSYGRERYCNLLSFLAQRYPQAGINLWYFPYHHQGEYLWDYPSKISTFYSMTQPTLLQAVRDVDPMRLVIVTPLAQGSMKGPDGINRETGGYAIQPYYENDPNIIYAHAAHNTHYFGDQICRMGLTCTLYTWDYNMVYFNDQFAPAQTFLNQHPAAKIGCAEFGGLVIHSHDDNPICSARPIEQSRFDFEEQLFMKESGLNSSWWYFAYTSHYFENPANPVEKDNVTETAIADLIRRYAQST